MCGPLSPKKDKSAERAAQAAAEAERKRRANIAQGTASIDEAFSGFNPEFYQAQTDAYLDYATPQLDDQFADAKKQLNFALARSGLSASTAGADQQRKLAEQYNKFLNDIQNSGLTFARNAEKDVENSRSDLLAQLTATEDPAAAATAALRRSELLSAPPAFDPLQQFVFEISDGLERASAASGYEGVSRSPLFGRGRGSSTVVN